MTEPTNAPQELPPLTVEAMRRFCQEMMKDNKGDYVFLFEPGETVTMLNRNDDEKTVTLD